ncbi:unnamed protein product [Clonostachys rhizophaga]|uniref:EKC/KEOPS complex subunit BUD32 n=1 Tax=Clonostachys rhizophaga TaxID=160324 RepID=A0A9N9VG86_9HYPO|nr:unnamed protein product [Clonostachys rhizophaga]
MFIVEHLRRVPFLATLWHSTIARCAGLWNLISRLLERKLWLSLETHTEKDTKPPTPPAPPRHITYWPIPGSWQRREHPNWPDSSFQIPENVPYGTIYYITKGKQVGHGATAHVEQLPSGHVVKYPIPNPYSPKEEEDHRRDMRIEAEIYQKLGDCPYIPGLIDWDPESCCLTLEYLEKGDLAMYIKETAYIPAETRQCWTLQEAAALLALHAAEVIHCDVTPRNFMLNSALDLHIADFAGSSVAGSIPTIAAGPRFRPPGWSWHLPAKKADDIFALGSAMYFIMVGEEPYAHILEEDVENLFREAVFPDVSHLICGAVIRGCWDGTLDTAEHVVNSLTALYTTTAKSAQAD